MASCPICKNGATAEQPTGDALNWHCTQCGSYRLVGTAETLLREKPISQFGAVSGWIRQQNMAGIIPRIADADTLRTLTKPPFRERAEKYLLAAVAKASKFNDPLAAGAPELTGAAYAEDDGDMSVIRQYLQDEELIVHRPGGDWRITAKGFITADDLRAKRAASSQAFVAMWFHKDLESAYSEGIEPAVRAAGYDPMLIRDKEHAGKIDDEIIAEIRRSAFLIADFTGHRGGEYFEAGYAMGRGLPIIWTCQKDDMEKLHFDIRQYNCIDWSGPTELAKRLQKRIEAMLGQGPRIS
jgi:nucleoside 2-deoxyribosyltransferase